VIGPFLFVHNNSRKASNTMTMLHSNTADAFIPEDFGALVDLAVKAKSVSARTATSVSTDKVKINFPIWTADPAVGWYNENDEIAETDGATDEVECTPTKTAALTPISNELPRIRPLP
jgi:HK97 family phage major capsid protein